MAIKTYLRVKIIQEMGDFKVGEIHNISEKDAKIMEKEGFGEIVKENPYIKINDSGIIMQGVSDKIVLPKKGITENEVPTEYLEILQNPNLFNEITEKELDKKIVKEIETRKTIFLCCQGRLVEGAQVASYNLLVNDEAGSGKDYVTSKTLEILPKETYVKKTRISPAVFTYWHNQKYEPDWTWDGKVFYTEDIAESVLNSEVFKVMCSSGSEATIVIKQRAIDIKVEGKPVMITTTANSIPNPELTRRFEMVGLDETMDQTKEIMKRHCEYARKGISPEYNQDLIECQKFLKRVKVKIPFAEKLHFLFPAENIMMRTKFPRFLDLIKASAAFHQFQRREEKGFIIAEGQDYELAVEVMKKLISNRYFVSLTKNQKRIVKLFEENPELIESSSKIRQRLNNFISLPSIITNLSLLTSYGILKAKIEEGDNGKEIEKYFLSESIKSGGDKIIFPTYLQLNQLK